MPCQQGQRKKGAQGARAALGREQARCRKEIAIRLHVEVKYKDVLDSWLSAPSDSKAQVTLVGPAAAQSPTWSPPAAGGLSHVTNFSEICFIPRCPFNIGT